MNFSSKTTNLNELLNNNELTNFKNYLTNKYNTKLYQNNCSIEIFKKENEVTIEFNFNLKYGENLVDYIFEPVLVIGDRDLPCCNFQNSLGLFFEPNALLEVEFDGKIFESVYWSDLLVRLKIQNKKINLIGNKYFVPLEFGLFSEGTGFIPNVNSKNLKIRIKTNGSLFLNDSSKLNNNLDLIYNVFVINKFKITNTKNTIKLLNNFFSNPNNKKLLDYSLQNKSKKQVQKVIFESKSNQTTNNCDLPPYLSSQNIPLFNLGSLYNQSFDIRPEIFRQPRTNDLNDLFSNTYLNNNCRNIYNYDNIQAYNSTGFDNSNGDTLLDYNFDEQIDEYKKEPSNDNSVYYNCQKEKLFNNKVSFISSIIKQIETKNTNNLVRFQTKSLSSLVFYFMNKDSNELENVKFDNIRLKLNGKTVFESSTVLLNYNMTNKYNKDLLSLGIYIIPYEFNENTDSANNFELVFDSLAMIPATTTINLFYLSKSIYIFEENSTDLINLVW